MKLVCTLSLVGAAVGLYLWRTRDITVGLRKPGTEGWHGAYVATKRNGKVTAVYFDGGKDWNGVQMNWKKVQTQVANFKTEGWIEMTKDDLKQF